MLWVRRQEGHPACKKTKWWGAGMVNCLERGADFHMAQLMPLLLTVSCFSNIRTGFTFPMPAHLGACVCLWFADATAIQKPTSSPASEKSGTSTFPVPAYEGYRGKVATKRTFVCLPRSQSHSTGEVFLGRASVRWSFQCRPYRQGRQGSDTCPPARWHGPLDHAGSSLLSAYNNSYSRLFTNNSLLLFYH